MKALLRPLFSLLLLVSIFRLPAQQGTDVMIQGFNWVSNGNGAGWYNVINSQVNTLDNAGFDMVWLPPPGDAASAEGYLPREWYNVSTNYGTQAQLTGLINNLHSKNIKAIADIVVNHRVGCTNWADFCNPGLGGCSSIVSNDEWGQNGGNPCGNFDTGDNYHAARDLDHTNGTVQTEVINWLNWLKGTIGFDGWRYDYVRGFNGYYNKVYNDATNPYFSVGELWDNLDPNNYNPHRQQTINWIDATQGTSTAFDFTTKGILQLAVNNQLWRLNDGSGKAPGVIGWWPEKAVTFIDNHDTGSTQNYWPFPGNKVMQGYAYILTHPGIPCVFWDHFFDWPGLQQPITDLIAVRKDNGIHSGSVLDIKVANWDVYGAVIDNKVAVKIGPAPWSPPGSGWTLRTSGNDYAVWDKGSTPPPTGIANGVYKLEAMHSGKVADVQYASNSNGTNVHQWAYGGGNNQRWTITDLGGGQYSIRAKHSGKAMEAAGFGTANGTNVQQWTWANANSQKWELIDVGGGYYNIKNVHNGKCLDVSGVSTANGANLHLWSCGNGDNQKWKLDYLSASRQGLGLEAEALEIFPNPTTSRFQLRWDGPALESANLQLFDLTGKQMLQQQHTFLSESTFGADLAAGMYILRLTGLRNGEQMMIERKLVKQ
ncbi:MAG: RICIN domain-containing protein [Bacteroidota bacterium]